MSRSVGGMDRRRNEGQYGFAGNVQTPNMDWLAEPAMLALNARPSADGVVTIPLTALAAQRGGR